MSYAQHFSRDYAEARDRFLAAARRLGLAVESHQFAARGPAGEPLFLDAARWGDPRPERVVVVSSGLHGIEGFFGSAVQLAWLEERSTTPAWVIPRRTALLFLHALNPYGFAWRRRWNENNVDLNRNFLGDRTFLESDEAYRESRRVYEHLRRFLNPPSAPPRWESFEIEAILHILGEGLRACARLPRDQRPAPFALRRLKALGLGEFQKTVPVGQYEHPGCLFFGGVGPEETTRLLREKMPAWVGDAGRVLQVDFHTGLGTYGGYKILILDPEGSGQERVVTKHFGPDLVEPLGGRGQARKTAYPARGLMAADLRNQLPGRRYDCLTAEFGTYSLLRVIGALRAENRAHFHAPPGSGAHARAKAAVSEAFCPADPAWREATIIRGIEVIDRAVTLCTERDDQPEPGPA